MRPRSITQVDSRPANVFRLCAAVDRILGHGAKTDKRSIRRSCIRRANTWIEPLYDRPRRAMKRGRRDTTSNVQEERRCLDRHTVRDDGGGVETRQCWRRNARSDRTGNPAAFFPSRALARTVLHGRSHAGATAMAGAKMGEESRLSRQEWRSLLAQFDDRGLGVEPSGGSNRSVQHPYGGRRCAFPPYACFAMLRPSENASTVETTRSGISSCGR